MESNITRLLHLRIALAIACSKVHLLEVTLVTWLHEHGDLLDLCLLEKLLVLGLSRHHVTHVIEGNLVVKLSRKPQDCLSFSFEFIESFKTDIHKISK